MKDVYRTFVSRMVGLLTIFTITAMFAAPAQSQQCFYSIDIYDVYGDGWDGATMTIKVNGVAVHSAITIDYGAGPVRYSFLASIGDVITTEYTAGYYPSEQSYRFLDGNGTLIYNSGTSISGPPNLLYTVPSSSCVVMPGCAYRIRMRDDYGDGWNDNFLKIYIDGTLKYTNIAIGTPGTGNVDYVFFVDNGEEIKITYDYTYGLWSSENEYDVIDPRNNIIFSDGLNGTIPKANNTVVGYGACSFDVAMTNAVLGYAQDYWAARDAADLNIIHATVTDIVGSNPPYLKAVYKVGSMPADSTDGVAEGFDVTWANDMANLTFMTPLTGLAAGPSPDIYVRVFVPEDLDEDNSNDGMMAMTKEVFDYKVMGYEDFATWMSPYIGISPLNDMGWSTADLDGGDVWQAMDLLGPVMLYHPSATNDWIFSPSAMLEAAASYRLQGEIYGCAPNTTIRLAYGPTPDPASMTVFATFSNMNLMGPTTFEMLNPAGPFSPYFNTPPMAGPYYIGIHLDGGILLSYLKFDENPSPPPKIGYGFPGSDISEFIDDEGAAINLVAVYKQPGTIDKTYEVATTTDIYGIDGDFLWDVETDTPWITLTKATPDQTLQNWNFTPERPRQFQTFTISVNPAGLAPGLHTGTLRFYGTLFNDDFLPPNSGLTATNEIYEVKVNLRIVTTGTKNGPKSMEAGMSQLVPGPIYNFVDPNTQAPIATVEVTSGAIDQLLIRVFPNQLPNNIARKMYVMRYWQLEHTAGGPWTANITFPYADQEAAMVFDRTQLRGIRQDPMNGPWEDPIFKTTSVSDPMNNAVTVFDLNETNSIGNIALAHPYVIIIKDGRAMPDAFGMQQNYPNPFNPNTTISYDVAEQRHVRIAVYNSLGAEVVVLVDETLDAGRYTTNFDASGLTSGTYIYRMTAGDFVQTRRMTLSK